MSIQLGKDIIEQLREVFMVANTPAYVVDAIVDDELLDSVVAAVSSDEIVEAIRDISARPVDSLTEEDAMAILALTASLSNREPHAASSLSTIEIPWLYWWEEIRDIAIRRTRSFTWEAVQVSQSPRAEHWQDDPSHVRQNSEYTVVKAGEA